jgi:hypothetical protein
VYGLAKQLSNVYLQRLTPAFPSVDDFISCWSEGLKASGEWDDDKAAKAIGTLEMKLVRARVLTKRYSQLG